MTELSVQRESAGTTAVEDHDPERRLLTVMFVDLVGSTELAGALDPEDLRELIRRYQIAVTAAVVRYEGYVAKFIGDGVMAYFGWPHAHEDEAERAVRAARDVLAGIDGVAVPGGGRLNVRIGIATGEVVVGNILGRITRDDQAAIGMTPNLADRLQNIAPPGEILIGPTTRQLLGQIFELETLGAQRIKGFADPVEAWRVLDERIAETRFEAHHPGELGRYVGREREHGLLAKNWDAVKAGTGRLVVVTGEAGIGKSRLIQEFRGKLGADQRFGVHYQCSAHHQNSAFLPAIQQVKRAAGIADSEPPEAKREKLRTLLGLSAGDLEEAVSIMSALLRIEVQETDLALNLPAPQLRQRMIDGLVDQVVCLSRRQPVLVTFEDVHWADASTLSHLRQLSAAVAELPVLIIATQRPEAAHDFGESGHHHDLGLHRVARRQAEEIVREIAGAESHPALVEQVVTRAEGVPLFVEELTKALLEAGAAVPGGLDRIPTSLRTSLVGRLDRLGDAKQIAQLGAVIGREFRYDLVSRLVDEDGPDAAEALDRLVGSGLVTRRGRPPEALYAFKHALIQDAAYGTILKKRRRQLHGQIVDLLEARGSGQRGDTLDLLAHHARQAEDWQRAYRYSKAAGIDAISRSALSEGVAHFDQALSAVRNLEATPEMLAERLDLRFELRNALWALGRFADILTHLDEADGEADALDDESRRGWIAVYRSASLWQIGRSEEALRTAAIGCGMAERLGAEGLRVAGDFYFGCARVTSGDYPGAIRHFEDVVNALPGERAFDKCGLPFAPSIISRSWLIWALAERGLFEPALHHASVANEQAEALNLPFNRAHVNYDVGYLHLVREDFDAAIETLSHGKALIDRWGLTYLAPFTVGFLGYAYARAGDLMRGIVLLEEANRRYAEINLGLFRSLVRVQTAEAFASAGQIDEAEAHLEAGLALADARGERGFTAHGRFVAGVIAAARRADGSAAPAREEFEEALRASEAMGMEPLAARCRARLAHFA